MEEPIAKEEFISAEVRRWNDATRNFKMLIIFYGLRDIENNEVVRTHFGLLYLN